MLLSLVALAVLWFFFEFKSWTTHAGLTLFIVAVSASTFVLYRNHLLISRNDFTSDPNAFLANLKRYQLSRLSLHNKAYWLYTITLSLGITLYFFEVLSYFTIWTQVFIILFTFGWMLFCSTLVRKAVIKRDKERISLLIEKFERLGSQFKENR
ncbi:hypothetical protein PBAL39_25090 [Pedobacter sp. BAL39]|uniref:hypothetical protein n=1 Tax=Pedobacter sp. BAL39 TaxID=391596 RepID=UPI000155A10D|nr:hypothetical protein [Pedobacter sp. BAL39]EDM36604.1 hypothetical protein PBAL39_25090 [Pedobacter sp. BAL39]